MSDTSSDLSLVLEPRALTQGFFSLDVPAGWGQARGSFGGIVLGAVYRAIEHSEPDRDRHLRSISGEIAGPVVGGAAQIVVESVRRGSGVSTWSGRLAQGDGPLCVVHAVLGRTRDVDRQWSPAMEPAPSWRECAALPPGLSMVPEFAKHFEFRPFGPLPFSGAAEAVTSGWIRPRTASRGIGTAELIAMADAWWPAAFSIERAPRPIATIAFTMQCLLGGRVLPAETPLLHRARAVASAQGFFVEMRELWTPSGELVALNQQTFVWIR